MKNNDNKFKFDVFSSNKRNSILSIIALAAIVGIVLMGSVVSAAFLTDTTDPLRNIFEKAPKFTLKYHANAGSEDVIVPEEQHNYGEGKFVISTYKPLREGFVFTNWNSKAGNDGEDVAGGSTYTTDNRHTDLYAQWQVGYTLIYDANGGKNAPEPQTQITDEASWEFVIKDKESMTHEDEHKVFLGWADSENATVPTYGKDGKYAYLGSDYYDGDNLVDIDGTKTLYADKKTVTVYAVWATKYELTYSFHPDMVDPECYGDLPKKQSAVTVNPSHDFTIPARVTEGEDKNAVYRKEGYKWGWWGDNLERFGYIEEDPTAPANEGCYLYNEQINTLYEDAPTITLYAYFQPPESVSVIFEHNTGSLPYAIDRHDKNNNPIIQNFPDDRHGWTTERIWVPWEEGLPNNIPTHPRYVFQGWAYTANATEPDVMPGEKDFKVNTVITNKHKLYAVWKSGHNFRLYFNYNGGSRVYYKQASGNWGYYSSNEYIWYSSDNKYRTNPESYFDGAVTWTAEFFSTNGVFAARNDDANGTYEFLGWAKDPNATEPDYPVVAPDPKDPENPNPLDPDLEGITGNIGLITDDVIFDHSDINVTSDNSPATHSVKLYAVWKKSPRHQFRIEFKTANGAKFNTGSTTTFASPSTTGYYASTKYPYNEWSITDLDNAPIATKDSTRTASYDFVEWNTKADGTGTKYTIDQDTKKINQIIRIDEPANTPEKCAGGYSGDHTLTLYPIFETKPLHGYDVLFDINAPSDADSVETYLYQSDDGTNFTKKKVVKKNPSSTETLETGVLDSQTVELDQKTYTYELDGKWMFVTCENKSTTSTSNYTFLGWSYTEYGLGEYDPNNPDHVLEFPVNAPADPSNPGDDGKLNANVVIDIDETDPTSSDACDPNDEEGKVHTRTLYGVWDGEPLHQYAVVFVGNGEGSKIIYAPASKWASNETQESNETISSGSEDFTGTGLDTDVDKPGQLVEPLKNTFRVYSEAKSMPDAGTTGSSESFTFDNNFWKTGFRNDNFKDGDNYISDVIVKAERADSADRRYTFLGWTTVKDDPSTLVSNDSEGYINTPLTINDSNYPCDSKTHHTVLYALWQEEPIHNFQLIFYANGGNQIGQIDNNGTWRYNSTSYAPGYTYSIKKNTITDIDTDHLPDTMYYIGRVLTEKESTSVTNHTWSSTDTNPLRLEARKGNTTEDGYTYRYEFMGWSDTPVAISTSVTSDDADYHVNDKSYIQENITITAPSGDCEHPTHTKILYAVWKKVLVTPEHSFTLRFNSNGGTSRIRLYDGTSWSNGSSTYSFRYPETGKVEVTDLSYTFTAAEIAAKGVGATRDPDNYYTYEFVGWSTSSSYNPDNPDTTNLISWIDDPDSDIVGDGFVNEDISVTCPTDPCKGGDHTKNIYAVWKRTPRTKTYTLTFNGNDNDAQGVPANIVAEETYTGNNDWNRHTFDISDTPIPTNKSLTFAGWNTDPEAKNGKYSGVYTGTDHEQAKILENMENLYTATLANTTHEGTDILYAIWWYRFEVFYDANGGSQAPPLVHAYDSVPTKILIIDNNIPNRNGYTFLGWSTSNELDAEVQYTPGQQITFDANDQGVGTLTLYAVWQED